MKCHLKLHTDIMLDTLLQCLASLLSLQPTVGWFKWVSVADTLPKSAGLVSGSASTCRWSTVIRQTGWTYYTRAISDCFRDKGLIINRYINSSVYFTVPSTSITIITTTTSILMPNTCKLGSNHLFSSPHNYIKWKCVGESLCRLSFLILLSITSASFVFDVVN